jgi:hypothetical protein
VNDAVQQSVSREGATAESPDSVTNPPVQSGLGTSLVPMDFDIPGAKPLRDHKKERFCRLRAVLRPKVDAYRQAGYESESDHAAAGNASRLERRQDVADRIAYLCKSEDSVLKEKQRRLEEMLWLIHEANVADMWTMVEVPAYDRQGKPILDGDGNPTTKMVQRPKNIHDMPEDVQRSIEQITINEAGFVIPKPYSKLQANAELRKLLGIGAVIRDGDDMPRLSDAELVAQLAAQARELGIEIDLNYRFGIENG